MYTHNFFVTSVRGIDFPPQTAASAGLRVFGAKSPTPFLPDAFDAVLPRAFFVALSALVVALVRVVFVVVVATVVFVVVVVIAIERMELCARVE